MNKIQKISSRVHDSVRNATDHDAADRAWFQALSQGWTQWIQAWQPIKNQIYIK